MNDLNSLSMIELRKRCYDLGIVAARSREETIHRIEEAEEDKRDNELADSRADNERTPFVISCASIGYDPLEKIGQIFRDAVNKNPRNNWWFKRHEARFKRSSGYRG